MSLKEMLEKDLQSVFFNLGEMGETHRIEGRELIAVFDDDALQERKGGAELGITESSLMLFAMAEDLPPRREAGGSLNVDGREYIIDSWSVNTGMATLALHQNRVG